MMARWLGCMLALMALAVLPPPPARAHETDQYTLPLGRDFADLGGHVNRWVYLTIERGVNATNARIDQALRAGAGERTLTELTSRDEIVHAVNRQFPNAYDVIEGFERLSNAPSMQRRFPGKIIGYKEQFTNVFQHVHGLLDPRQFFRIWHASTFKVYGTYLGSDKMGHFTDMGMHYYRAYSSALRSGRSEEQAVLAAVNVGTHGAIFSERGAVGLLSAGAYSNADLLANYIGFLFYKNLTDPVMLKGQTRPPMLQLVGRRWVIAPHVRADSDFFQWFVSDHLNEALNPSLFENGMRPALRQAVRDRTPAIMARYADIHGARRPREYFDDALADLSTYYGQYYGHEGTSLDLVTIANTCFSVFPDDADPAARDHNGFTPLHVAAAWGDRSTVERLLARRADPNVPVRSGEPYSSEWGNTPLHYAARSGDRETLDALLQAGADVNAANDLGVTPLHKAGLHPRIVLQLIRHAARVNAQDAQGRTPLHWAAIDGNAMVVDLLLQSGADANLRDHSGQTALHQAVQHNQVQCAAQLLAHGADPDARDDFSISPLHLAAAAGNVACVDLLLIHGAQVDARDAFGCAPLHEACRRGRAEVVALLLDRGADMMLADGYGNTPLHTAARSGCGDAVENLIDRGADVLARNRAGSTPQRLAAATGHPQVASLLAAKGAGAPATRAGGRSASDASLGATPVRRSPRELAADRREAGPTKAP